MQIIQVIYLIQVIHLLSPLPSEEHPAQAEGDKKLWPTVALAPTADYEAAPSIRRILFTPAAKSFMINGDGPVLKAGLEPQIWPPRVSESSFGSDFRLHLVKSAS